MGRLNEPCLSATNPFKKIVCCESAVTVLAALPLNTHHQFITEKSFGRESLMMMHKHPSKWLILFFSPREIGMFFSWGQSVIFKSEGKVMLEILKCRSHSSFTSALIPSASLSFSGHNSLSFGIQPVNHMPNKSTPFFLEIFPKGFPRIYPTTVTPIIVCTVRKHKMINGLLKTTRLELSHRTKNTSPDYLWLRTCWSQTSSWNVAGFRCKPQAIVQPREQSTLQRPHIMTQRAASIICQQTICFYSRRPQLKARWLGCDEYKMPHTYTTCFKKKKDG